MDWNVSPCQDSLLLVLSSLLLQRDKHLLHGQHSFCCALVVWADPLDFILGLKVIWRPSLLHSTRAGHSLQGSSVLEHKQTGLGELLGSCYIGPAHADGWWQPEVLGAVGRLPRTFCYKGTVSWKTVEKRGSRAPFPKACFTRAFRKQTSERFCSCAFSWTADPYQQAAGQAEQCPSLWDLQHLPSVWKDYYYYGRLITGKMLSPSTLFLLQYTSHFSLFFIFNQFNKCHWGNKEHWTATGAKH